MFTAGDAEASVPTASASAQEGCVLPDFCELTTHRKRQRNVVVWW